MFLKIDIMILNISYKLYNSQKMTDNDIYVVFKYNSGLNRISFDISIGLLKSLYIIDKPNLVNLEELKKIRDGEKCDVGFSSGGISNDGNEITFSVKSNYVTQSVPQITLTVPHSSCVDALTQYIEHFEN